MRIAILASYPVHTIPGFEAHRPRGHYPTWLPQLCQAWEGNSELDLHWLVVARHIRRAEPVRWRGQTFHFIHVPDRFRFLRLYRRDCRLIREKLDEINPDFVHAWGTEDCHGLAAVRSGRRFLLSMQGILTEYARRSEMHPYEKFQAIIERYVLRRTRLITSESTWGCDVMRQLAPHAEIHRVEYGVQEPFFAQPWQPDAAAPFALFVGTAEPRKGLQDLVAAFSHPRLAARRLVVLGDGPVLRKMRAQSPANIEWLGRRDRDETLALMARAWCLVLPTRADTSPNVVKEARVIGLPVITSPHGGQRDYVFDGENGWIVENRDIDTLVGRLEQTLSDLPLARRLGDNRHAEQRQFFRPENTAAAFLELYRRYTATASGGPVA